jgi:hypothetical protein
MCGIRSISKLSCIIVASIYNLSLDKRTIRKSASQIIFLLYCCMHAIYAVLNRHKFPAEFDVGLADGFSS